MESQLEIDQKSLDKLIVLVHKLTGITMNNGKKALLQGRLRPRIKKLGLNSFDDYMDFVITSREETQEFVNLVTTNETQFFRTPRIWEYFTTDFLPKWHLKNAGKTLRIWSGASSSGEEIYTIAICCEDFKSRNPNFHFQILGTDISTNVLREAEKAVYSGRAIENFRKNYSSLFEKYMSPCSGEEYKVQSAVASRVKFGIHNLFQAPREKGIYDIVFLRNVLIYFTPADQEIVLSNIAQGLMSHGTLIIGESESLNSLKVPFDYRQPLIYQKSGT